ncbi:MAG: hypothetical protein AB1646_18480 [Thermodesulfobacteriota bacterium]
MPTPAEQTHRAEIRARPSRSLWLAAAVMICCGAFLHFGRGVAVPQPVHVPDTAESSPTEPDSATPKGPSYPEWWGPRPAGGTTAPCRDPGRCVTCHETQATMDPSHALSCTACHRGNPDAEDATEAHRDLIKDPGDLRTVEHTCGKCHPEPARRVKRSPMALATRMINHVRFAFGGQGSAEPMFATVEAGPLKEAPVSSVSANLGDDLLRRSCLRCHLRTKGSTRWGETRGQGCSACHSLCRNGPEKESCSHVIVRSAGMTACLKCHNANHVGGDFVGLYEKDFGRGFTSPLVEGKAPPRIYGAEQHRLVPDVHYQRGMQCTDCHTVDEIHGSEEQTRSATGSALLSPEFLSGRFAFSPGPASSPEFMPVLHLQQSAVGSSVEPTHPAIGLHADRERWTRLSATAPSLLAAAPGRSLKISCEGCHVRGDHPALLEESDGTRTLLKGTGRRIPMWDPRKIPHSVPEHQAKVRCSACHAAWSFQDYGLHLMLEERADYWKWAPTAGQNDPQVQELLLRNVGTEADPVPPREGNAPPKPMEQWEQPAMKDWLSGETRPGAWFRGYTIRRWSDPPLGLDSRSRVSIMRPMYQYVVTHVGPDSKLLLDSKIPTTGAGTPALIFNPYEPHTTSARGRNCHECHGNPKAIGLGESRKGIAKPVRVPLWKPDSQLPELKAGWDAIVDEQGTPLQFSSHPGAGPLDASTVKRLLNPSDRHRALWHKYLAGQGTGKNDPGQHDPVSSTGPK